MREQLRPISWFALCAILLTFIFMLMLYGTSLKQVTLVVNGEEQTVTTRLWQLDQLLVEYDIELGPHDRLYVPAHDRLKHGDRIEVVHTHPITLVADGHSRVVYTVGKTVEDVFKDMNIQIGELDRTEPAFTATLDAGDTIRIIRVRQEIAEIEKEIPYTVVTKNDSSLAKGKEKVVREGKEGVLLETVEHTYEDGILVATRVIDTVLAEASVDKVVAVGTKKPVTVLSANSPDIQEVTKKGVTFGVKQILTDVTLTSYDAGPQSTGKDKDHPLYGITYSGAKVKANHTIAVDPKVIPLGWWVYIEGFGFRKAEDIGSAIKGKKIDIYFEDAVKDGFGKKKGVTVYIIGPKKPAID